MSSMQMELEWVEWFLCQPPVVHPASKAGMNHLLWFRRCRRNKLQTGVVRKAQSGTKVWTTQWRVASERCFFTTYLCSKTSSFGREAEKDSLDRERFNIPKQTDPAYKIKAIMRMFLLLVSAQRMAVSLQESSRCCLHQHGVYSHTTYPIPQC